MPAASSSDRARLRRRGLVSFFRPREAAAKGIAEPALRNLVRRGVVERVGRGLYRIVSNDVGERPVSEWWVSAQGCGKWVNVYQSQSFADWFGFIPVVGPWGINNTLSDYSFTVASCDKEAAKAEAERLGKSEYKDRPVMRGRTCRIISGGRHPGPSGGEQW